MIPGHVREDLLEARRRTALHLARSRGQHCHVARAYSAAPVQQDQSEGRGAIAWMAAALAVVAVALIGIYGPRVLRILASVSQ